MWFTAKLRLVILLTTSMSRLTAAVGTKRNVGEQSTHRKRLLCLSRGSHESGDGRRIPSLCGRALASHASAPQPERSLHVGADAAAGRRLAPSTPKLPPLAKYAICRQPLEVRTRPGLGGGR